jgi:hypothetical protein
MSKYLPLKLVYRSSVADHAPSVSNHAVDEGAQIILMMPFSCRGMISVLA